MAVTYVSQISLQMEDVKLRGRVVRLWHVYNSYNARQLQFLEMVIVDEQGTAIHAGVNTKFISYVKPLIQEGEVYEFSNFEVTKAVRFLPVAGDYKLYFTGSTIIDHVIADMDHIPSLYIRFASIPELEDRVGDQTLLSDVVGMLIGVGDVRETFAKGSWNKIRNLKIRLQEDKVIMVTLWKKIAVDYVNPLIHGNTKPFVVVLTSSTVGTFLGAITLNSTSSTILYPDLEISEVRAARERLAGLDKEIVHLADQGMANEFVEKRMQTNRMTIKDVLSFKLDPKDKEYSLTVQANIVSIVDSHNWYYVACSKCKKKVWEMDRFICQMCTNPPSGPLTKFRIQVLVSDTTGSATFILFDRDSNMLLGVNAKDLLAGQEKTRSKYPPQLDNLINRSLIFELKITPFNMKNPNSALTVNTVFIPSTLVPGESSSRSMNMVPLEVKEEHTNSSDSNVVDLSDTIDGNGKRPLTSGTPEDQVEDPPTQECQIDDIADYADDGNTQRFKSLAQMQTLEKGKKLKKPKGNIKSGTSPRMSDKVQKPNAVKAADKGDGFVKKKTRRNAKETPHKDDANNIDSDDEVLSIRFKKLRNKRNAQ